MRSRSSQGPRDRAHRPILAMYDRWTMLRLHHRKEIDQQNDWNRTLWNSPETVQWDSVQNGVALFRKQQLADAPGLSLEAADFHVIQAASAAQKQKQLVLKPSKAQRKKAVWQQKQGKSNSSAIHASNLPSSFSSVYEVVPMTPVALGKKVGSGN